MPELELKDRSGQKMFSWDDPKDRAKIVRLTADLRNVEVELLSAVCAADRLRLHYSTDDIARFGEERILQKAIAAANSLSAYFSAIAKKMSSLPADGEASE
jgi:hypothetical protein